MDWFAMRERRDQMGVGPTIELRKKDCLPEMDGLDGFFVGCNSNT